MKLKLFVSALLAASALSAQAAVVDFEDLSSPGCCTFPASGYHGFEWSGAWGTNSWVFAEAGAGVFTGTNAHSGNNFAWSNGGADLSLSGTSFDFNSMWARGGWSAFGFDAHGFKNGVEVYTKHLDVSMDYSLLTLDFKGVDRVVFDHQGTNLLIDDITVNAVPEPQTYALLLAGLAAIGFTARRRKA